VGNGFWRDGRFAEAVEDPACPVWGSKVGRSAAALSMSLFRLRAALEKCMERGLENA
jgi:hypothetical protein